ncbi:ESPR-type extended signal peptide-containing protein [Veillonella sp.]
MNKVYRVIFNVKKGCYTVVSEIAKRTGKSGGLMKSAVVATSVFAVLASLGGISSVDAANYVNISGTEGSISASASKGMFGGSKEFNFNSEGISVTGTDYAGSSKKNTTIQDGKVRVSNAAYGNEHYTEIDGGSVRTENLKVVPTIKDSLEFKQGGLVVRSEDSRLIVSKNGIDQSVDNGRGQSNSVKVKQNGTVFRTTDNGATGATETVIAGETIAAGDISINGEQGQSTITGLTNTTVDAQDFATQGRAATEEQLSAVRKEIKDSGTVINQQITNINNRVNTVEQSVSEHSKQINDVTSRVDKVEKTIMDTASDVKTVKQSVDAVDKKVDTVASDVKTVKESVKSVDSKVTKVDARVTNVETKVSTIDTNVSNLGKEVKSNTEVLTAHTTAANNRFASIESNINTLDQRVGSVETGISSVNQRVSNLDSRINKVGAGAAALAALHPVSGDGTKFGVAAGVGIYNGQKAVAIGGSYSPNDMTTISVGGAVGNGENMVNAGVSLKVGAGNAMSKAQMNSQIKSLQAENSALKAKDAAQDTQLQELRAEIAALKASMTK